MFKTKLYDQHWIMFLEILDITSYLLKKIAKSTTSWVKMLKCPWIILIDPTWLPIIAATIENLNE